MRCITDFKQAAEGQGETEVQKVENEQRKNEEELAKLKDLDTRRAALLETRQKLTVELKQQKIAEKRQADIEQRRITAERLKRDEVCFIVFAFMWCFVV